MKIPKGWKKVKRGTFLRKGDKFFSRFVEGFWMETLSAGEHYNSCNTNIYIRKITKK